VICRILDSTNHAKLIRTIRVCHVNRHFSVMCRCLRLVPQSLCCHFSAMRRSTDRHLSAMHKSTDYSNFSLECAGHSVSFLCKAQVTPPNANTCHCREMTNHTNSILHIQHSVCKFIFVCGCMCVCMCACECVGRIEHQCDTLSCDPSRFFPRALSHDCYHQPPPPSPQVKNKSFDYEHF